MNSPAIKHGLYLGAALVIFYMLLYFVDKRLLFNVPISFVISIVIPLVFMYLAGNEKKEFQDGYMSFGEAVKETFFTYLIGSFVGLIFTFILFNLKDPSLIDIMKEETAKMSEAMLETFGASEEVIEENRENMENMDINPVSPGMLFLNWLTGLLFPGIIISLILSAIIKKNPS